MDQGPFFEQFIDDYYAECDEHIAAIRRVLISVEELGERAVVDVARLNELRRSLHTVKGLSGMVGLGSAERTAHLLEDLLRSAGTGPVQIDHRFIDALFEGVRTFERCVAAHRDGGEEPSLEPLLRDIAAVGALARSSTSEDARAHDAPVAASTVGTRQFQFTPSAEASARGISVEVVRERLRGIGDVLEARPRVTTSGIVFEFDVGVREGAAPHESWRSDGITWAPDGAPSAMSDAAPSPAAPADQARSASSMIRVDLAKIEEIMRAMGDLVVSRSRLGEALRRAGGDGDPVWDELQETNIAMERQLRALREGVMRVRLVRIGEVFERLRYAVRDVARDCGKEVALTLAGQDTEIDKAVVDRMLEPLMHLVRNAVSHGIEAPAVRRAAGKHPVGRLALRAAASGDRIIIDIEDDGAGIDSDAAILRARRQGLDILGETPAALLELLCTPGFSTRDDADMAAGRGVGLAVVRSTVHELGGDIAVVTDRSHGTRFTVELPLTLMIVDALLVDVGPQLLAVPQPVLREILQIDLKDVTVMERNEIISWRGQVLPLVRLRRLFGMNDAPVGTTSAFVLVVGSESQATGLVVDRLLGLREIVVHPVTDPLIAVPGVGGATELADGRLSLILDTNAIVRFAHSGASRSTPAAFHEALA